LHYRGPPGKHWTGRDDSTIQEPGPRQSMSSPIRVLTIGHSYVVAANRALARNVARDPDFEIVVAGPSFFHGDLRSLAIEPEPVGSPLKLVPIDAHLTRSVHLFQYNDSQLRCLLREGDFDVVHAWEEPYIYAGYQIAMALK